MRMTTAQLGTVLSIWAHPDDETYLAGATMAAVRDAGGRVVCASATAGEHGTADPQAWPPHRLGAVRRLEAAAAMAVLGVAEHEVLGLPDGGLDAHDGAGEAWVAGLLDRVGPDTVLTFGPDGQTFHPDHLAVHRWVRTVWERRGRPWRLLCAAHPAEHLRRHRGLYEAWGVYMAELRPVGVAEAELALHVRARGPALDRKLTALRAMATQTADVVRRLDPPALATLVAEEAFVDASSGEAVAGLRMAS